MGGNIYFSLWLSAIYAGAVLSQSDVQRRLEKVNDLCYGRPDSYYPDTQNGCKTYLACVRGQLVWATCPMGTRFDDVSKRCLDAASASCPGGQLVTSEMVDGHVLLPGNGRRADKEAGQSLTACSNRPDGLFPNYDTDCKTYFECSGGAVLREFACDDGMSFDAARKACVQDGLSRCRRRALYPDAYGRRRGSRGEIQGSDLWRRLVSKRQIKFSSLSPGLLKAMGEVLEQLGENMETHA